MEVKVPMFMELSNQTTVSLHLITMIEEKPNGTIFLWHTNVVIAQLSKQESEVFKFGLQHIVWESNIVYDAFTAYNRENQRRAWVDAGKCYWCGHEPHEEVCEVQEQGKDHPCECGLD